jgi:hypothetical protein
MSLTLKPASLREASLKPALTRELQSTPAFFRLLASRPWAAALPNAASTAFTARSLCMPIKSRVRATADAMSCSEEEKLPALAA